VPNQAKEVTMRETIQPAATDPTADRREETSTETEPKMTWETPQMEDVSEQVMAQPYIRFT
jgi:hypothetical protein